MVGLDVPPLVWMVSELREPLPSSSVASEWEASLFVSDWTWELKDEVSSSSVSSESQAEGKPDSLSLKIPDQP